MRHTWRSWLVLVVATALMAVPAAGVAQSGPPVAISAEGGTFTVTPLVAYDHLSLRVAAPDGRLFEAEASGGPITFRPFAIVDYTPPSGSYVWQVLLTPRGAISRELRERVLLARESGDATAEQALRVALHRAIVVQSGAFAILDGKLIAGDAAEPAARVKGGQSRGTRLSPFGPASLPEDDGPVPVDQVIPDDLIVQGSLCVGFDCVNNENFGFDTIRLKENNLRIKFEDTSAGTFPTIDWQLTANDSASGGASKFSIEDITNAKVPFTVSAGASTNSIFVDSTGRVGFRTSTPVLDLHVATSNTPAARLEQNSSGGFTAQTWDVAGNEANFFIRDVTSGSRLPLRIRPGAPTSSLDISADGDVGIGTASPEAKLHVSAGSSAFATDVFAGIGPNPAAGPALNFGYSGLSFGRGSAFFNSRPDASAAAPNPSIRFATANNHRMILDNEGFLGLGGAAFNPANPIHHEATNARLTAVGIWQDGSSREIKRDIEALGSDEARTTLVALAPIKYASVFDPADRHLGFIAEDVPDLVATPDRKSLSPMDIVAVLTRVLQDQQRTVEAQEKLIAELAAKIAALEAARPR
jgi:hypothetical protein